MLDCAWSSHIRKKKKHADDQRAGGGNEPWNEDVAVLLSWTHNELLRRDKQRSECANRAQPAAEPAREKVAYDGECKRGLSPRFLSPRCEQCISNPRTRLGGSPVILAGSSKRSGYVFEWAPSVSKPCTFREQMRISPCTVESQGPGRFARALRGACGCGARRNSPMGLHAGVPRYTQHKEDRRDAYPLGLLPPVQWIRRA